MCTTTYTGCKVIVEGAKTYESLHGSQLQSAKKQRQPSVVPSNRMTRCFQSRRTFVSDISLRSRARLDCALVVYSPKILLSCIIVELARMRWMV